MMRFRTEDAERTEAGHSRRIRQNAGLDHLQAVDPTAGRCSQEILSSTARLNHAGIWSVFSSRVRPSVISASQV